MRSSVAWLSLFATSAFTLSTITNSNDVPATIPTLAAITQLMEPRDTSGTDLDATITVGVTIWVGEGEVAECTVTDTITDTTTDITTDTVTACTETCTVTDTTTDIITDTVTASAATVTVTDTITDTVTETITIGSTTSGQVTTTTQTQTQTQVAPVTVCPSLVTNPSYTPITQLPDDYTWGCPPGYLCKPPHTGDRAGCNVEAGLPADTYVCSPDYCIEAPVPLFNDDTGYNVTSNYYNLDPMDFGLSYDILDCAEESTTGPSKRELLPPHGKSEQLMDYSLDRLTKRVNTGYIPSGCYKDCNIVGIIAEETGKQALLCAVGSTFLLDLGYCEECISASATLSASAVYSSTLLPTFAQWLNFCSDQTTSTTSSSTSATTTTTEVTTTTTIKQSTTPSTTTTTSTEISTTTTASTETTTTTQNPQTTSSAQTTTVSTESTTTGEQSTTSVSGSTVTVPKSTTIISGSTVTVPGSTVIVSGTHTLSTVTGTASGSTVTIPESTTVISGSTVIVPASTVIESGTHIIGTITGTASGSTVTIPESTTVISGSTMIVPASTVIESGTHIIGTVSRSTSASGGRTGSATSPASSVPYSAASRARDVSHIGLLSLLLALAWINF
ncbi:hypothetical protein N7510_005238 [Penicillium lagena]|uniref:uncharacterized protein n=1 Tax=Penicillium lagena TaxID=94218 RepID=UPI002541B2B0|nr:uncharacterized protein N7510_005238 [Penicillium lagena]KAJ5612044.1 hypothetical protein N7510_005238 [Penicillium lagena]